MSSPNSSRNPKNAKPPRSPSTRLDFRNLPSMLTGLPDALYEKYCVTLLITGPRQIQWQIFELNDLGQKGKQVPIADALELTKAAGFVHAESKNAIKSEETEATRTFFYQRKLNAKKVKDPKTFVKTLKVSEENLNKSRQALKRASEDPEDQNAKIFYETIIRRADNTLKEYYEQRTKGVPLSLKEAAATCSLPHSMMAKTITRPLEVPPNGKLWTALSGPTPDKYCSLTLKEIKEFPEKDLLVFYPPTLVTELKAFVLDKALASYLGSKEPKEIPKAKLEKLLSTSIPAVPFVDKGALLQRAKRSRFPKKRSEENSVFIPITKLINKIIDEYYVCPPSDILKVRTYWETLAGCALHQPDIASQGYIEQATEKILEGNRTFRKIANLEPALQNEFPKSFIFDMMPTTAPHVKTGLDKYHPPEIVGYVKSQTKKQKLRSAFMRKSELTAKSKNYLKRLKKKISIDVYKKAKGFLRSFSLDAMQEIAAKIVFLTNDMEKEEIRRTFNNPDESSSDEDDEDEDPSEEDEPVEQAALTSGAATTTTSNLLNEEQKENV